MLLSPWLKFMGSKSQLTEQQVAWPAARPLSQPTAGAIKRLPFQADRLVPLRARKASPRWPSGVGRRRQGLDRTASAASMSLRVRYWCLYFSGSFGCRWAGSNEAAPSHGWSCKQSGRHMCDSQMCLDCYNQIC